MDGQTSSTDKPTQVTVTGYVKEISFVSVEHRGLVLDHHTLDDLITDVHWQIFRH